MLDFRTATFLNVCKTMNYTQSARELNITQPAVSQHIAFLEKVYEAKLFDYHKKKLTLTVAGIVLRDALRVVGHDERVLKEHIAALSRGRRTLRLGVTLTAGEYVLACPLAFYLAEEPAIQTRVVAADTKRLLDLLKDGSIDCALVEGFFDKSRYGWEFFCSEELLPVCAPGHQFAREPRGFEDLLEEHLLVRERGSGTRAVLEHALAAHNLSPESFARVTEISSPGIIKTFVESDYGISFLYQAAVLRELKEGRLCTFALSGAGTSSDPGFSTGTGTGPGSGPNISSGTSPSANPGTSIKHDMTFIWLKGSLFEEDNRTFVTRLRTIYQNQ